MVFRNSHPQKKTDVGKSWPLRRVWHLVFHESGFCLRHTLAKRFSPWNFCWVFWVTLLRSSDYMSVKIWPPMLPICQDWTCLGGQNFGIFGVLLFFFAIGRCFCWQSGAWRVTLPQTTLCFCWSCFGWYVIGKQKKHGFVSCLWFWIFLIFWQLTTFAHGDFFSAIFWGLKPQGFPWRFGWTLWRQNLPFLEANGNAPLGFIDRSFWDWSSFFEKVRQRCSFQGWHGRLAVCIVRCAAKKTKQIRWVAQVSEQCKTPCRVDLFVCASTIPFGKKDCLFSLHMQMGIPKPWL